MFIFLCALFFIFSVWCVTPRVSSQIEASHWEDQHQHLRTGVFLGSQLRTHSQRNAAQQA